METVKVATEWAKDEVLSTKFFILFGIVFILACLGFWQLGKSDVAKSFIYPSLVAGVLLLVAGLGMYFGNKSRLANFETQYNENPTEFVKLEIIRTEKAISSYRNTALKVFPVIIAIAALSIVFVEKPIWRAISITVIAFLLIILYIDSNALVRVEKYNKHLMLLEKPD